MTHCTYPICNCPFDAPTDPNWCARGLPKAESHFLKNVEIRLGNNSLGWIGQTDDGNVIITAAELDALRKDAERLDAAMKIMFDDWHPLSVAFGKMAKASTKDELLANLDAAIAAEGEK